MYGQAIASSGAWFVGSPGSGGGRSSSSSRPRWVVLLGNAGNGQVYVRRRPIQENGNGLAEPEETVDNGVRLM